MANVELESIEMDTTIQCRAAIDMGVVNDYADGMSEGDKFPPVVLFGSKGKSWIGDGWHRIMAAQSLSFVDIEADLRTGGRADALKHALGSNAIHGHRRSNPDKRRCIEIAFSEFPRMSDSAIGKLCGLDHKTVAVHRPSNLGSSQVEKRIGLDGKERPATRTRKEAEAEGGRKEATPQLTKEQLEELPPSMGLWQARRAINELERIESNDTERQQAFEHVKGWCESHATETTKDD